MAGYISIEGAGTGFHAVIERDADGQYWKPGSSAWEAFDGTHWASYAIDLLQLNASLIWRATFPSAIAAGLYTVRVREGAASGATQASEPLDNQVWDWGGASRNSLSAVVVPLLYGSAGSVTWPITVKTPGGDLLPGAAVYVSSDLAGTNRSEVQLTDSLGVATFHLDPGTIYVWVSDPSFTFSNPYSEQVQ